MFWVIYSPDYNMSIILFYIKTYSCRLKSKTTVLNYRICLLLILFNNSLFLIKICYFVHLSAYLYIIKTYNLLQYLYYLLLLNILLIFHFNIIYNSHLQKVMVLITLYYRYLKKSQQTFKHQVFQIKIQLICSKHDNFKTFIEKIW